MTRPCDTATLGNRLRQLRKENNLTQQQLADQLGLAKSVVSYYENDERNPSYDVLRKICQIFHVTSDYMIGMERSKLLNVSDLSEESVGVLMITADALTSK